MAHLITLIPGDGIGPEVAEATVRAVEATGVTVEWERVEAGARALVEQGQLIPDDVYASLEATRRVMAARGTVRPIVWVWPF